jgi:predicted  nucleic acid-binding Zn-ribbon protein
MSNMEYKSPPHKLIKFFKESRDSWEETAKKRREEIRNLQARVRDLETSRELWKTKARAALQQDKSKEEALEDINNVLAKTNERMAILQQECDEFKKKLKR